MFDPFKKLKLAGAFLGVADDAAAAGDNLDISELFGRLSVKDLRAMALQPDVLLDLPGVRALYETRYMPAPEPLERLLDLGEGTLGAEYVRYLRQHKLPQPQPPRRADYSDPAVYLAQRVRMTHALLHVVTEYDASPLGELALQAYYIGQLGNLISGVIISSAILQIIRDTPDLLGPALEVTSEAFQRGKEARSFLGIAWEELWSAQVPQLRELIGIPSRTSIVAQLHLDAPPAPPQETRSNRPSSFNVSAFSNDDGPAGYGRSSSSGSNSTPKPSQPRVFSGFNSTPVPDDPPGRSDSGRSDSGRYSDSQRGGDSSRREPSAPEPRSRASSTSAASSSLLASFMALAEQSQQPQAEPAKPEPKPEPKITLPPRTVAAPPRVDTRPPVKTPPPPPVAAKPAAPAQPPEPTYKVEEPAKHVTPALSPDDPDYF